MTSQESLVCHLHLPEPPKTHNWPAAWDQDSPTGYIHQGKSDSSLTQASCSWSWWQWWQLPPCGQGYKWNDCLEPCTLLYLLLNCPTWSVSTEAKNTSLHFTSVTWGESGFIIAPFSLQREIIGLRRKKGTFKKKLIWIHLSEQWRNEERKDFYLLFWRFFLQLEDIRYVLKWMNG